MSIFDLIFEKKHDGIQLISGKKYFTSLISFITNNLWYLLRRSNIRNGPGMIFFFLLTSFEGYYRITQHKIDTRADCWLITVKYRWWKRFQMFLSRMQVKVGRCGCWPQTIYEYHRGLLAQSDMLHFALRKIMRNIAKMREN